MTTKFSVPQAEVRSALPFVSPWYVIVQLYVPAVLADTVQFSSVTFYPAECPAAAGWEIYTLRQGAGNDFLNADVAFSILVP